MTTNVDLVYNFLSSPENKDTFVSFPHIAKNVTVDPNKLGDTLYNLVKTKRVKQTDAHYPAERLYKAVPRNKIKKRTYIKDGITDKVLTFIYENPNCNRIDIFNAFPGRETTIRPMLAKKVNIGIINKVKINGQETFVYIGEQPKPSKSSKPTIKPKISSSSHDVIDSIAGLISENEDLKKTLMDVRDIINSKLELMEKP